MKIPVERISSIAEPMAQPWKVGHLVSTVTMADGRGYGLVITEHNEFETVPFYAIKPVDNWNEVNQ